MNMDFCTMALARSGCNAMTVMRVWKQQTEENLTWSTMELPWLTMKCDNTME